jgi:hypothetical protein
VTLELTGTLSGDGRVFGVCVWCQTPSDSEFMARGLGRSLPLHALCAARVIRAYERFLLGHLLETQDREGLGRVLERALPGVTVEVEDDPQSETTY